MPLRTLALLLLLSAWPLAVNAEWTTTRFEVFFGSPWTSNNPGVVSSGRIVEGIGIPSDWWTLDEAQPRPAFIPEATVAEVELYLREVAEWMEAAGFNEPELEPLVEGSDGQLAYRIYLHDMQTGVPARYGNACLEGQLRQYIEVDIEAGADNGFVINGSGRITDKGYQDLAHELFHAVQAAYPLFDGNCDLGDWIVEGQAQAVGADAALALRKVNTRDPAYWGARRYHEPLWVQDDPPCPASGACPARNDAYWTASLWRYLGEMQTLKGQYPGPAFIEPDYSYLHRFLIRPLGGPPSEANELEWLDHNVSHTNFGFGKSLDRVYATFATTFASYPDTRQAQSTAPNASKRGQWQDLLFDGCQPVAINPDQTPVTVTMDLAIVSAACLRLEATAGGVKAVSVTAHHDGSGAYADLWVGTQQGQAVGKPLEVRVLENEFAEWRFRVDFEPGEETLMVISNVAADAEETGAQIIDLRLTATDWTSSVGSP